MTAEGKISAAGAPTIPTLPEQMRAYLWAPCFALMLLAPWPALKVLAGMSGILSLRITGLKRPQGMLLLASLFSLAYFASPYGLAAASAPDFFLVQALGRTAALFTVNAILLAAALLWAGMAAGEVRTTGPAPTKKGLFDTLTPWLLAASMLAANLLALRSEVPIQGDEGWHIWRARLLRDVLSPLTHGTGLVLTCSAILLAAAVLLAARRLPLALKAGLIGLLGLSAGYLPGFQSLPHQDFVLMRYPFISVWLHQIGLLWETNALTEGVYRLLPMLSVFAIGCFALWVFRKKGIGTAGLGFGLAFVLAPTLHYHSTILYLELPALALLLVVLYNLETLLTADFRAVRGCPGWYALVAVGFFKETLVFFLCGIIALRLVHRLGPALKSGSRRLKEFLKEEAAAVFCILLPPAVYLFFRMSFTQTRGYHLSLSNLWDWELYAVAAKGLFAQFGGVLILAVGGLIVGLRKPRTRLVLPVLALFLLHAGMHFLDRKLYVGLARFNLFLFAPLAILALEFIVWLRRKQPRLLWPAAAFCLVLNLALSPVSFAGEKRSGWVTPIESHSSEYYFPYQETLQWLKANRPQWPVLFACSFSRHLTLDWYFEKARYAPAGRDLVPGLSGLGPGFRLPRIRLPGYLAVRIPARTDPTAELHSAMALARQLGYPLVLYHRKEGTPEIHEVEKRIARYGVVHAAAGRDLSLILYQTEHPPSEYFPYQAAVEWLQTQRTNRPILIGGTWGRTRLEWYFGKRGYRPRRRGFSRQSLDSPADELRAAIGHAREIGFPLLLFHRINLPETFPNDEREIDGYAAVKMFRNPFHKTGLVVYESLAQLENRSPSIRE